jgi:hypothetical protein
MQMLLRYADLKSLGVFNNRVQLGKAIQKYGFPAGQLTTPNCRTWAEAEVQAWIASRPIDKKPGPKSPGRPRKTNHVSVEA